MIKERRRYMRFKVPLHLKFKLAGEKGNYITGTTINFSRAGLCFEVNGANLKMHEPLELRIQLPRDNSFISVLGEVVWQNTHETKTTVGVKLRAMNRDAKWEILEYGYNTWINDMIGGSKKTQAMY
jgi:c-di-GMP-binding flagellar brake protein YcgR